ncbi:GON-4-like protein isoform X1 [Toxotes jaculatrix]|uniref:GON-4-like protein isoform X1 n=1 Tax=Toxotes jaculatrix TaxID=941984 RepID=UPI001B3AFF0F|nr:GON-4-like protein isoform X1 [Toxotes jaculatrix]XP_040909822.1 GON-4-like protein isoform X1 [Toxotes jaculatrix]XP_040909823.1 GON-4-like protein isoform X1 [Toxotes jaculatrix]
MTPVRKRVRLSPSTLPPVVVSSARSLRPPPSAPQPLSHDALQPEEEEGYLLVEEDTTDSSLVITMEDSQVEAKAARRRAVRKRRAKLTEEEEQGGGASDSEEEEAGAELEIDRLLDQSLETKSKQHNLTTVNVRNIIHEVITNEHVVAMMKAAINETEAVPPFEPKMTRSKFKEVVEKGVVIPAWNISPIKKTSDINKAPQFVDIPLAEEDSSDEEYRPDEEEDEETAEDTFQESDMESTASSPRGSRLNRAEEDSSSPWQTSRSRSRNLRVGSISMGPPPPPKAPTPKAVTDSTFLEKLHAVEEELAVCMEPYQPLSESENEVGLMAYRTRSKRPLRDVPLGRLEAELQAPDITPDMYEPSSAHEDREWTDWLRGLMSSDMDNEEECDDEDDPEYNFLADIDEPDLEDYRDDKAVRITKKEVNELMEELFETLKEDLVGQEVDDEGHEEEEEPPEETHTVQTHTPEEQHSTALADDEAEDGPITELRTVKQQLALIRKRRQTHTLCPEPYTLKLDAQQKTRLQLQLQQHIQLLTQIHLLSSPVAKLHNEAETTRQFLFELDVLAQRAELLMSSARPGFCSVFRSANLQGALQLLEELRQTPISYQPQHHPPDARGHMRCYPMMPAELAWLFATRPVFLYPELLPCVSLDPDLYCPRRTAAFTAAEDCLLVLGLRNMEGSCDPTKLVSQFLLRKTLVQVRRRILQCCRPGSPDNIVKAFRYQRVLWPMPVACRPADPAEQRPPVERQESVMPLWLVRSLPVIYPTIKCYNAPPGSAPEAPPPCRWSRPRQSHLTFLRSASNTYSFPPGTRYAPRLPKQLDFRRIGFVLLQQPLPLPPADSSPLSDGQVDPSSHPPPPPSHKTCCPQALRPPRVLLHRLPLTRTDNPADIIIPSTVSMTTTEQIRRHYQTLVVLRRKGRKRRSSSSPPEKEKPALNRGGMRSDKEALTPPPPPPPEGPTPSQVEVVDDIIRINEERKEEEQEEEESEVLLVLSESSSSTAGSVTHDDDMVDPEEVGSESEQEVTLTPSRAAEGESDGDDGETSSDESRASVLQLQEKLSSEGTEEEEDEDDRREAEEVAFAQDYLHRVLEVVQVSPGLSEQLLQVLDQFSAEGPLGASGAPELLYDRLSCLLQPWPQLLRDFAAFLSRGQARRCGLLWEQQLFERSRRFLRRLGRSLGESSSLYQQVVSVLQGSPTPPPEDMDKISSLLAHHPDLHQFFHQLHSRTSPIATSSETTKVDSAFQKNRTGSDHQMSDESGTGSDREEEEERAVCAKNISMTSTGEKVVIWTREADRAILTACQQRGANRKTFRQVSAHLGNKTTQQVSLRFHDLINLFQSSSQKSTSCSSECQPISSQEVAPD